MSKRPTTGQCVLFGLTAGIGSALLFWVVMLLLAALKQALGEQP